MICGDNHDRFACGPDFLDRGGEIGRRCGRRRRDDQRLSHRVALR
jgi:hypothetical protein